MRLGVTVTLLDEVRLITRAAEIALRRQREQVAQSQAREVSDVERDLGAAAGDLHQPDDR